MFKALILMVALAFSSVSYGTPGLVLARTLIKSGHYERAVSLIKKMEIPFKVIVSDLGINYPNTHWIGRELGLSFDDVEKLLDEESVGTWMGSYLEDIQSDYFPKIIETWREHGMKLDIEKAERIISSVTEPDVDLDEEEIKKIIKFVHDHMEE